MRSKTQIKAQKKYREPSDIQKLRCKEVCGYEYPTNKPKGRLKTEKPYDKDWDLSPWTFSYIFQKETGHLICELDHRMTNNRTFGWDYQGKELDRSLIDTVFPPHF